MDHTEHKALGDLRPLTSGGSTTVKLKRSSLY